MNLVTNRDIAVQRILRVRIRCKCANKKRAIREISLHRMLVVVIYDMDTPAVLVVLFHMSHVVDEEIERFQALHEGRGGYVCLRSGSAIPEGQRPGERRSERCFYVFSRYKNKRFMEAHDFRAGMKETEKVIDYENVEGL